jgi:hypothetical protein
MTLKETFPLLFSIAHFKEACCRHMQFSNDSCQSKVTFIRVMHDWEMELVTSFFNLLYSIGLRRGGEDIQG